PNSQFPMPNSQQSTVNSQQSTVNSQQPMPNTQIATQQPARKERLIPKIKNILEETSGEDLGSVSDDLTFLEMGLDSLSLTQVALNLQKEFNVKITFRQLLETFPSLETLSEFIDGSLPPEVLPAIVAVAPPAPPAPPASPGTVAPPLAAPPAPIAASAPVNLPAPQPNLLQPLQSSNLEYLIGQQLQIMSRHLELLGGGVPAQPAPTAPPQMVQPPAPVQPIPQSHNNGSTIAPTAPPAPSAEPTAEPKKVFGAAARIDTSDRGALTPSQKAYLETFVKRYTARTQKSKQYAQTHRHHLADPRVVSGFNRTMKELVYPIVTVRSSGSKLWDKDDNEYVDLTNGFGSNFFGYSAPFITEAIAAQMQLGFEIGPQTPLAGEVAELVCEMTKHDRAAFCNTGSEAVLGAMRLARTVTGNNTIVTFTGDYHGNFDEVIVRGTKKLRSLPAAPGIPQSAVDNTLILDYGEPESLEILKARAGEFAAIMVEPVQSRRPDLQPREFLHEVRRITEQAGCAFIMDEVITGFRVAPGGAQEYFGVQADIGTYGKVVGGGMPIGVIAGKSAWMDALDGGFWQFGDDSFPEVGVTYFAGTFVRHPLTLAAAKASLEYLKRGGPSLQRDLNAKTDQLVAELNAMFDREQAPFTVKNFGSLFKITYPQEFIHGELLFYSLREKGIHIWDHRPCFLTLAHSDADIAFIKEAFKNSIAELQSAGFFPGGSGETVRAIEFHNHSNINGGKSSTAFANNAPVPGAKLGRDPNGNPAWYVADPERPGKHLQVGDNLSN
ncbi:aminotransferase class III-fold pyridoxal phosphate-dependent enzyme, partial [Tychonema sp. LEGE 07196]